jgi:hypothetical protein
LEGCSCWLILVDFVVCCQLWLVVGYWLLGVVVELPVRQGWKVLLLLLLLLLICVTGSYLNGLVNMPDTLRVPSIFPTLVLSSKTRLRSCAIVSSSMPKFLPSKHEQAQKRSGIHRLAEGQCFRVLSATKQSTPGSMPFRFFDFALSSRQRSNRCKITVRREDRRCGNMKIIPQRP